VGVAVPAHGAMVATRTGTTRSAAALPAGARPLFPAAVTRRLAARAALLGHPAPDLGRWYAVPRPGRGRRPAPPPTACRATPSFPAGGLTPDLSPYEDALGGLGLSALGPSGMGAGVDIGDVEYSWRASHEELAPRQLPAPPNRLETTDDHGTAVLTIIGAGLDGQGVVGLAPAAGLTPRSPYADVFPGQALGADTVARTIATLAAALQPGDVLLVEQQAYADAAESKLGPVELRPAARDAIAAAVASGVVVVEPAGNGDNVDVGYDVSGLGVSGDSGALMVGAGTSDPGLPSDRARAGFSNYGARVNVQGYGQAVVAGGYGGLWSGGGGDPDRSYTACFSGTSSAAATVAAAVADLQAVARVRTGAPLTPAQVRERLVATGAPQQQPNGDPIGPRPDVSAAVPPQAPVLGPLPAVVGPGDLAVSWASDPLPTGRPPDQVLVDGVPVALGGTQASVPLVAEGAHEIQVRSVDHFGLATTSAPSEVTVDATAPPAPTLLGPSGGVSLPAAPVTFSWSSPAGDSGGAGRDDDRLLVDGVEVVRVAAGVGRATVYLGPGPHTWTVSTDDRVGNGTIAAPRAVSVAQLLLH
jgi:hypothetical protein